MKRNKLLVKILGLLLLVSLAACGSGLEEGPCTNKVEFEYETTLGWLQQVSANVAEYDSYEEYLAAYREPLERWQGIEPITTCDAALIELMTEFLSSDPGEEQRENLAEDVLFFDLDIAHTGR